MPSEILWRAVLFLFVHCATILFWFFLDNAKKRRRPHKKISCAVTFLLAGCASILCLYAQIFRLLVSFFFILWFSLDHIKKRLYPPKEIFICADCWLEVFHFLAPSQLGLEIALISRRFDFYVDEHFKTRKWMLNKQLKIQCDIEENGTKKMQIVKFADGNPLPIPQKPLPNKVIGFSKCIHIIYIDQNVLTFLGHFHRFFAAYTMDLEIVTENGRILEFVLHNIWPMFRDSIRGINLNTVTFRHMCQLAPSMLTDCPALRLIDSDDAIFPEFLPDDSAMASDGQVVAKWLFTPRPDGGPKWLTCHINSSLVDQWSSTMEQLKTAFSNASSPVTFRIRLKCSSTLIGSILPFELINEVTGEQLILQQDITSGFWLTRCPIGWDEMKWDNVWKQLSAARPRRIRIWIKDGGFDDGLLLDAASPGPSDH